MKAMEEYLPWDKLTPLLTILKAAADNSDVLTIRTLFKNLIPEYIPEKKVLDWIYNEEMKNHKDLPKLKSKCHSFKLVCMRIYYISKTSTTQTLAPKSFLVEKPTTETSTLGRFVIDPSKYPLSFLIKLG